MQVVNFFILAISFVTAAYVAAMQSSLHVIAGYVAVGGAVIALSVLALEVRTRQLVEAAKGALKEIEHSKMSNAALVTDTDNCRLYTWNHLPVPKYDYTIPTLIILTTGLFIAGAVYSLAGH